MLTACASQFIIYSHVFIASWKENLEYWYAHAFTHALIVIDININQLHLFWVATGA